MKRMVDGRNFSPRDGILKYSVQCGLKNCVSWQYVYIYNGTTDIIRTFENSCIRNSPVCDNRMQILFFYTQIFRAWIL